MAEKQQNIYLTKCAADLSLGAFLEKVAKGVWNSRSLWHVHEEPLTLVESFHSTEGSL